MAEDQCTGCPIFIERCITGEMRRSKKALPSQYNRGSKQASCDCIAGLGELLDCSAATDWNGKQNSNDVCFFRNWRNWVWNGRLYSRTGRVQGWNIVFDGN